MIGLLPGVRLAQHQQKRRFRTITEARAWLDEVRTDSRRGTYVAPSDTTFNDLADAYLDAYCEKADMPKQLVFQWLPIVAAAELARGHKDNEEALLSWIDVADWQ